MPAGGVAAPPAQGSGVRAGVFGKLPVRGDFVRLGLPRDFVDPWDAWWGRGLLSVREIAGEDWVAAWLEAPVWHFVLPPGLMGRDGVAGVWMPSVDRAGRYFPLTVAAAAPYDWAERPGELHGFLAGAERAGLEALERDLDPEAVLGLAAAALDGFAEARAVVEPGLAAWWTEGAPRVSPRAERGRRLPEGRGFAGLIDDGWGVDPR
ncbi:type VI secretion system-associated protein TagF [Pararoseomonas sp. SCSIO 73927]|uniref:type VI secretion system-associated protein TagF n=1 Tax=Pararoseomonas sp. SCSIO 73927 TaxID=3114537 RepID=UPI0030D2E613